MADEGYILLWRRFFGHRYWTKSRKFSKAEAWIDMIAMASFRDREILVGRTRIQLERGELLASVRFLAKRWRWGRDVVHAFIKDAEKADEITTKTRTPEGHVYLIVKYDDYQLPPDSKPDKDRTRTGQNRIKVKKEKKEKTSSVEGGWSKPAEAVWKKHMGGTIPPVRLNVALSPLVAEHGAEEVLNWWGKYLTSSTAAQFKTPENFAQRFGAWRREHSTNGGATVDDIRRCMSLGRSFLPIPKYAADGFKHIEAEDPELWSRVKDIASRIDWTYLDGCNEYQLTKGIEGQLKRVHD